MSKAKVLLMDIETAPIWATFGSSVDKTKTQKCSKCNKVKTANNFSAFKKVKSGLQYECKLCNKKYKEKNKKKYKNLGKQWRNKNPLYAKINISAFLTRLYSSMRYRVQGRSAYRPDLWAGKPIMPREVFFEWAKNHPDFLKLFKRWNMNNHDQKLTPSINRINSNKGYTLDNVEWMTFSQNSSLAGMVHSINKRKAIYSLLGDKNE